MVMPTCNPRYIGGIGSVGSGDLGQMSEYPTPLESTMIPASQGDGGLHSCILRRSCKPEFLLPEKKLLTAFQHPKEKIQGLIHLPQG
jgi:hypothetical protein